VILEPFENDGAQNSPPRYLGPSSTTEAVKRPELGLNSVPGSVIEGGKHGIASQQLTPERRAEKLVPVAAVRGPGSTRRVSEDPGGAFLVISTNAATAPGAMKPFAEMTSG
jgi:hypothetical protein